MLFRKILIAQFQNERFSRFTQNVGQGNGAGGLFSLGNIEFNGEVYFNGMR